MAAPGCCQESKSELLIGDRVDRLQDMAWLLMCATYAMKELQGELTQDAFARAAAAIHAELGELEEALKQQGAA